MSKSAPATLFLKHVLIGFSVGLCLLVGVGSLAVFMWLIDRAFL